MQTSGTLLAGLTAALLLVGCGTSEPERPQGLGQTASYQCGSVPLETQAIDRDLLVTVGDRAYRLSPSLTGSGVKYSGGTPSAPVVFQSEAQAATFSIGFRRLPPCDRLDVAAVDPDESLNPGEDTASARLEGSDEANLAVPTVPVVPSASPAAQTAAQTASVATPPANLQGPQWQVEEIAGVPLLERSRATLEFHEDGSLGGFASCNSYRSSFEAAEGGGLSLGQIAATRKGCPLALMQQERNFLRVLEAATSYRILPDGKLAIETADGETLIAQAS